MLIIKYIRHRNQDDYKRNNENIKQYFRLSYSPNNRKRSAAITSIATYIFHVFNNLPNQWNRKGKELITSVAKGLGPSIYNVDSSKVSGTDPEELARVKQNYLINKLGLSDGPELDVAIAEVMAQMGSSNRNKYRANVYALLCKKFGKEGIYA